MPNQDKFKICTKCKLKLNIFQFSKNKNTKDGLQSWCITCVKEYRINNIEKFREYDRINYLKNGDKVRQKSKDYRKNNQEKCRLRDKKYRQDNLEYLNEYDRKRTKDEKLAVIKNYGGKCVCCGENKFEFLTIDHVNGGGNKHRKKMGIAGNSFYKWLRKLNYPKDEYRLLCMNCNSSLGWYGYCPHNSDMENINRYD